MHHRRSFDNSPYITAIAVGEKLSESTASDVRELCTTLLNCYLIQLLETGFLHADPHPGNLIRTPDGKICILDFGLMTEVSSLAAAICIYFCFCHLSFCSHVAAVRYATIRYAMPQYG